MQTALYSRELLLPSTYLAFQQTKCPSPPISPFLLTSLFSSKRQRKVNFVLVHILATMSKTFTQSDVASHNKSDSLWIVVDGDVYDLTKFQDDHPGS
jgi:cytochrome b involved in lipid metabolism